MLLSCIMEIIGSGVFYSLTPTRESNPYHPTILLIICISQVSQLHESAILILIRTVGLRIEGVICCIDCKALCKL